MGTHRGLAPVVRGGSWSEDARFTRAAARFGTISGFADLSTVGGDLWTGDSPVLTDVDGFLSLARVGGQMTIVDNDALTNMGGLSHTRLTPSGSRTSEKNGALTYSRWRTRVVSPALT